jgi:S-adenosylmethionine decarboxylase
MKKSSISGKHLLVDFFGVSPDKLRNRPKLMSVLCMALKKEGFNILRKTGSVQFKTGGKGITGFCLLSESHASFHSYPEYGYLALDIYSCGKPAPEAIAQAMEQFLLPLKKKKVLHNRGKI